ncbi:protein RIC-3, partial [Clupea harengus]|uniref:Protein RIC-3 n=1 Tax=Clupea harengus TaxID=7950 RepID=A0A6P8FMU6_CLUHA
MSITTFQKVTLLSCIVLCVTLFLPKTILYGVKNEILPKAVGPGHYHSGMHRRQTPEGLEPWEAVYSETRSSEAIARAQAKGITWGNKRSNHFGQIVPIYGVGILFYILHIFFKLTKKDKKAKPAGRCPISNSELLTQDITEEELAQLEAGLTHAEMIMNRVLTTSSPRTESVKFKRSSKRRQSSLLRRLRRFGRSVQEEPGEGRTPEMEAEEVPYGLDWEGYAEETYPQYDVPCGPRKYDTIIVEAPPPDSRSAEELAEQMDKDDDEVERELGVIEEGDEELEEGLEETKETGEEEED